MEIQDIKDFLDEHGKDDEVKKFVSSLTDSRVTQGIKTALENYEAEKVPKIVDEKIMERDTAFIENEKRLARKERAFDLSRENNLPFDLVHGFISDDPEEDLEKIQQLLDFKTDTKRKDFDQHLLSHVGKPVVSDSNSHSYTEEDYERMPRGDRTRLTNEGKFDHLLGRD